MKTKVVIISETIMDGVGKHIVDVVSHLDLSAFELTIIHSSKRLDYRFYEMKEKLIDVVDFFEVNELIREIHPVLDSKAFMQIYKILKRVHPDIVHCHSSKAGVVGRLAARCLGVNRIFYTPHAYAAQNRTLSDRKKKLYLLAEKWLERFATTAVLNVSEGERTFALENGIGTESKLRVLYNSVEPALVKEEEKQSIKEAIAGEFGLSSNKIVIGTVARLYTQKNPFEFLEIAKRVCDKNSDAVFAWIGEGEFLESAREWVKERELVDRILFLGHRKGIEKYHMWFDIYLTSALYEGLPYTLIEALSASTPIVASDVIGNNELVIHEKTGYLYSLGECDKAVMYLQKLIETPTLREEMGNEGHALFKEKFDLDKMIQQYVELYRM